MCWWPSRGLFLASYELPGVGGLVWVSSWPDSALTAAYFHSAKEFPVVIDGIAVQGSVGIHE